MNFCKIFTSLKTRDIGLPLGESNRMISSWS